MIPWSSSFPSPSKKFKQLGLPEPWFVITHTIWTTQVDTVFISDRIGTVVNVQFWDQTFRGTPSLSVKARKNEDDWRWGSPSKRLIPKLNIDYRSYPIANKNCVVQIVCVITNQGSSNPNCLNFLRDAYKVYQGVPPTYSPSKETERIKSNCNSPRPGPILRFRS